MTHTESGKTRLMYIGEVAKFTGLTIKAIRFYEAKGLIPPAQRSGRYRVYHQTDLEILLLIKEAKAMGIRLSDLKEVVQFDNGKVNWQIINQFLQGVKQQIQQDIKDLADKIRMIDQCMEQINH